MSLVLEFVSCVVKNLVNVPEEVMDGWVQNPKALQRALTSALCPPTTSELKVFKTIKLGTPGLKTADDFRKAINVRGMKIGDWANDILSKPTFTVATVETEVDLVVISVAELGFKNGATREQIYARAKEHGLDPCPAEVGPQLRLQYENQPNGEWLVIVMEPITDSDGDLGLFFVERDGSDMWLRSFCDWSDFVWFSGDRFVFSRRK